ncbi:kinase-like protein [Guyanagaster necrorhizus]|uniref:non-specific serine/threonine protein kinase n=1 Tax=Guyanagaster necrorhizus TaxID=856835 RepID=A0A9P7VLV2_9AGAR|nr:kinase-like protein [Guyanagaster necrorhizus MCA 3950]KAG7442928.1 kinase-like protein [Guyanagaster necrorhizus MCA 3950]
MSYSQSDTSHSICHVQANKQNVFRVRIRDTTSCSSLSAAGPQTPLNINVGHGRFLSLTSMKTSAQKPCIITDVFYTPPSPPSLESSPGSAKILDDSFLQDSTTQNDLSNLPPSILAFDIIGTLGRGTYGKVLLGTRPDGSGLRAIKVLQKSGMHRYGMEEVRRELRTLQLIAEQPMSTSGAVFLQNMVESFENERFVFIVFEYHPTPLSDLEISSRLRLGRVSGVSASISLPCTFPIAPSRRQVHAALHSLRLLSAELVLAVLFLHQNGIIHQDLKPANVMVSAAGHVIVGDFGASSYMNRCGNGVTLQPTDVVTFTPLYAAPELKYRNAEGLVVFDGGVDWWSLGVMLYELAMGSVPFRTGDCRTVGDFSHAFGQMEEISSSEEWWDRRFEEFIRDLLVQDPLHRINDQDIVDQPVFDPICDLWDEIAAMKHPPLPCPSVGSADSGVGLSLYHRDDPSYLGRLPSDFPLQNDDNHSLIQPLPSSASIYQLCTDVGDEFSDTFSPSCSSTVDSGLDIGNVIFSPSSNFNVHVASPLRREGKSDGKLEGRRGKRHVVARRHREWTLDEKIAISLLKAVECRKTVVVDPPGTPSSMNDQESKPSMVGKVWRRLRKFSLRPSFVS